MILKMLWLIKHIIHQIYRFYLLAINDLCVNLCGTLEPQSPSPKKVKIEKQFYIRFFDDHYFVDGIMNRNFAYGTFPTGEQRNEMVSHFKQELLKDLKENL